MANYTSIYQMGFLILKFIFLLLVVQLSCGFVLCHKPDSQNPGYLSVAEMADIKRDAGYVIFRVPFNKPLSGDGIVYLQNLADNNIIIGQVLSVTNRDSLTCLFSVTIDPAEKIREYYKRLTNPLKIQYSNESLNQTL